jgi:hypothetical protein
MDTLAFNQSNVVAQNIFNLLLFKASRTAFTLSASIIGHNIHKVNKQAYTKNKAQIKKKL